MKGLAVTLSLEFNKLNNGPHTEEAVRAGMLEIAQRLIDRFDPKNKPSSYLVSEVLFEECARINTDITGKKPHQHFDDMADRITRYFELFDKDEEWQRPLAGLPSGDPLVTDESHVGDVPDGWQA